VLDVPTRSLEFDSGDHLYIETINNDGGNEVRISQLDPTAQNSPRELFTSYGTTYYGVTGLSFDGMGNLYTSERTQDGNAGAIRKINATTGDLLDTVVGPNNHRPTGVDSDAFGNVYYTGRRDSNPDWGNVYRINETGDRVTLIPDIACTGIAVDDIGRIFVSTSSRPDLAHTANSIYMFDPEENMSNPLLIATFEDPADEIAFDEQGNLYSLDKNDHRTISLLAPVPVPPALWLLGSGVLGLFYLKRTKESG
jgi:streptogramin lyase